MHDGAEHVDNPLLCERMFILCPTRGKASRQQPLGHSQANLRQHDRVHQIKLGVPLIVVFDVFIVVARRHGQLVLRELVGQL